ncbi:hypothetical protein HDU93_003324 [Gonapodya sp. JEL0774]|nr:hypothetical protein HDU93_003324 [Gonapodya sp. JEL0774]
MAPFLSRRALSPTFQSALVVANSALLIYFLSMSWYSSLSCSIWFSPSLQLVHPCPVPGGNVCVSVLSLSLLLAICPCSLTHPSSPFSSPSLPPSLPNLSLLSLPPPPPPPHTPQYPQYPQYPDLASLPPPFLPQQPSNPKRIPPRIPAAVLSRARAGGRSILHHAKPDRLFLHHPSSHPALVSSPWFHLASKLVSHSIIPDDSLSSLDPDRPASPARPTPLDLLIPNILRRNGGYVINPHLLLLRNLSHLSHHHGILPQTWDGDESWFLPTDRDMRGAGNHRGNRFALDWTLMAGTAQGSEFVKDWLREAQDGDGWWWRADGPLPPSSQDQDEELAQDHEYPDHPAARLHRLAMRHTESVKILRAATFTSASSPHSLVSAFARADRDRSSPSSPAPSPSSPPPSPPTTFSWSAHLTHPLPPLLAVLVSPPLWSDAAFAALLEGEGPAPGVVAVAGGGKPAPAPAPLARTFGTWDERDVGQMMREIVGGDLEEVRRILRGEGGKGVGVEKGDGSGSGKGAGKEKGVGKAAATATAMADVVVEGDDVVVDVEVAAGGGGGGEW